MMRSPRRLLLPKTPPGVASALALSALALSACADDRAPDAGSRVDVNNSASPQDPGPPPFIPEPERDFTLSKPARVGRQIYVANETLNSVAIIDAQTLGVTTLPVGARPTRVVGPSDPDGPAARVMVLNEGSASVSVIDPATRAVQTLKVMPRANALVASPDGRRGVAWYDRRAARAPSNPVFGPEGDLSSVTVITPAGAFAVAVGFHVRRVTFSADSQLALILTDDGLSVLDLERLDADAFSPPIALLPDSLGRRRADDLEVAVDPRGRYAVTRTRDLLGVALVDLASGRRHVMPLPEAPSDLDLVEHEGQAQLLIMLRNSRQLVRVSLPEGVVAAAEAAAATAPSSGDSSGESGGSDDQRDQGGLDHSMDMSVDMSTDMSMQDAGGDGVDGSEDMSTDMSTLLDLGASDMSASDMSASDMSASDMSASDMGSAWPPQVPGVTVVPLPAEGLGAASVSGDGSQALLYTTTRDGAQRVVLYDMKTHALRLVPVDKGISGVLSDAGGSTFLVFHRRESDLRPSSPSDPAFIASSWGLSVINVAAGAARLILTTHEAAAAALLAPPQREPKMFVIFAQPFGVTFEPSRRDVLSINLTTFRMDTLRVPSSPREVGVIPGAWRVFVNQLHPQGRITFVDADSLRPQTVTGYQLNAGID